MKDYINEQNYEQIMTEEVLPLLLSRRSDGFFFTHDGKEIHFASFTRPENRGSVTICHGYTESVEKYRELIYAFLQNGLDVWVYEHRGHGTSERDIDNTLITHVDNFDDYVEDLTTFTAHAGDKMKSPRYLYAHSMGGAIAALFLESGSTFFRRAVLSSPMIAPTHGKFPYFISKLICHFEVALGRGKERVFTSGEYTENENFENSYCTSKARFDYYCKLRKSHKEFRNCAPTYRLTLETMNVTRRILREGAVERIRIPIKIYSAGNDNMVMIPEQKKFAERLPDCEFVTVKRAKHEIYRSSDDVFYPYLDSLLAFFEG